MTIVNNKLYFSAKEMERMNTLAVMLSATGLTCAPWQNNTEKQKATEDKT